MIAIVAAAAALALGGSDAQGAERTKLKLRNSPHGKVLFADGYAMYVFTSDRGATSECYGACAKAWPPLIAEGEVVAGSGVKERKLKTTERDDGSMQITYAGKPLYGYVDDPRGRVFCHDVREFGGTWYAVKRSGKPAPH
jgi:predicted lipoprotein with Yx(FWY)xxD motif